MSHVASVQELWLCFLLWYSEAFRYYGDPTGAETRAKAAREASSLVGDIAAGLAIATTLSPSNHKRSGSLFWENERYSLSICDGGTVMLRVIVQIIVFLIILKKYSNNHQNHNADIDDGYNNHNNSNGNGNNNGNKQC